MRGARSGGRASVPSMRTLVTGATGYIGGRLVPRLVAAGHTVRVFVRDADRLRDVPWSGDVEVATGDLRSPHDVAAALDGVEVLYYLVHSMTSGRDFETLERRIADTVARAAGEAGVRRIVYLGGLHPDGPLSRHLRSRAEVGEILLASGVPTAVRDVLHYLIGAATLPADVNRTFDIGGPDVLRYGQMMNGYALEAGLKQRPIASLPVLTPYLASQWVNLVTPIPRSLAVPIISSLQYDAICSEHDIEQYIAAPEGGLTGYRQAVRYALAKMREGEVETSWRNAAVAEAPADPLPSDPEWSGATVFVDHREADSDATPDELWRVVEGIGGDNGWYSLPVAWAARGWLDKLVGGVGLRRGRLDPERLQPGDALDFWRVEQLDRGTFLRLRAEMKLPGRAWLEFRVSPREGGGSHLDQRAVFFPSGLGGRLYWGIIIPFHGVIFPGMAEGMARQAEANARIRQEIRAE
ncbi:SDR family oxidoreductase [Microcella alkaliphila]|nr:SDR family oxidoreductase [Microcella alkaliphila]